MERFKDQISAGRHWAREFLFGDYRGAPVDYVMALAIVAAAMVVVVAGAV